MLLKFVKKCELKDDIIHIYFVFYDKQKLPNVSNKLLSFKLDEKAMFYSTNKAAKQIANLNTNKMCISLSNIDNKHKLLILQLITKHLYTFTKYKTDKKSTDNQIIFIVDNESNKILLEDIIHQINITNINRDFQNEPANKIYPETFCKYAIKLLGKNKHLKTVVLDDHELKKQGFNLIYAIGKASVKKPRFMNIYYTRNPKYKTICLIGKGVCFDLGGVNIKEGDQRLPQMLADKSGGCEVIALIKYVIESKMKINIVGLIPLVENVISGNSTLPGDIIKSYSGTTVEITNVDAEGRLILADAFGFSGILKEIDYVINLCTLTGHSETYHADTSAAIYSINKELKNIIEEISEEVGERVYFLPPWSEYVNNVKSERANVKNYYFDGHKGSGGAFMAAQFLSYFVPKRLQNKWVHFDITHSYTGSYSNGNTTILMINLLKRLSIKI
jgi:leucyl aminopeptidase